MRDDRVQHGVLETLSSAVNYRRWVCDLAEPWLGEDPLEVGSGIGDHAAEWARPGRKITVSETDPDLLTALRVRFADDPGVAVRELTLPPTTPGGHSAVVALNVLEHVADDLAALRGMRDLVRPGGHVVLFVPAFPLAMSRFDREVGHHRRYRRGSLARLLVTAGLEVRRLHHVNAPGLIAWLLLMRLGRGRPSEGPALAAFERLVPVLRRVEARVPPPFGQSLFAVGRV